MTTASNAPQRDRLYHHWHAGDMAEMVASHNEAMPRAKKKNIPSQGAIRHAIGAAAGPLHELISQMSGEDLDWVVRHQQSLIEWPLRFGVPSGSIDPSKMFPEYLNRRVRQSICGNLSIEDAKEMLVSAQRVGPYGCTSLFDQFDGDWQKKIPDGDDLLSVSCFRPSKDMLLGEGLLQLYYRDVISYTLTIAERYRGLLSRWSNTPMEVLQRAFMDDLRSKRRLWNIPVVLGLIRAWFTGSGFNPLGLSQYGRHIFLVGKERKDPWLQDNEHSVLVVDGVHGDIGELGAVCRIHGGKLGFDETDINKPFRISENDFIYVLD